MAKEDIFGYDRSVNSKEILSADFATLSFGDEKAKLVQQVQGSYQHKVEPRFETGSSALYWVNGQPMGQLQMGSVVGSKGWFQKITEKDAACALLEPITVRLNGDNRCDLEISNDTLKLEDALLQSVNFSFSAGDLDISEQATIMVSKIIRPE